MSRYIDANALQRHGQRGGLVHWKDIENAPHIDIVRCKECRWASPNKEGDYDCKCHIPIFRVDAEGYCYLADRKESE